MDTDDDKEETFGLDMAYVDIMGGPMKVCCDASTDFLLQQFTFGIAYVDPNIGGKRVGNATFSYSHGTGLGMMNG